MQASPSMVRTTPSPSVPYRKEPSHASPPPHRHHRRRLGRLRRGSPGHGTDRPRTTTSEAQPRTAATMPRRSAGAPKHPSLSDQSPIARMRRLAVRPGPRDERSGQLPPGSPSRHDRFELSGHSWPEEIGVLGRYVIVVSPHFDVAEDDRAPGGGAEPGLRIDIAPPGGRHR